MKKLTKHAQEDMANQMCNKARDIDICIFNALDGTMPKDLLLDCLTLFETKDGFARGLHIDNYNVNTSVYQVYEALRMLDMLDFDSSCDLELYPKIVNKCFNYLYNRAEFKDNKWNPNVKTNDDFAHAKIFSYNDENKELFGYHPTAAILGYTLVLCDKTKAYYKKALRLIPVVVSNYINNDKFNKFEHISFLSLYNSLKKTNELIECKNRLEEKLIKDCKEHMSLDFNDFDKLHPIEGSYGLPFDQFKDNVDLELDHLISSIKSFGLWDYNGTWGYDKYPEEDSAKLKWIGCITAINYFYLKKYGRLD
ncbi:MAG: hypothetical protein K6E20_04715 [Acholeplasmatales bacterium]|nr:hypothetical protein [Acholeplasmatales bacterium]